MKRIGFANDHVLFLEYFLRLSVAEDPFYPSHPCSNMQALWGYA
jgi:hypothetical protein